MPAERDRGDAAATKIPIRKQAADEQLLDLAEFRGRTEERLETLEESADAARIAREVLVPRLERVEDAVVHLSKEAIPSLTHMTEEVRNELAAQRRDREVQAARLDERAQIKAERVRIIKRSALWLGGVITSIAIAVISAKLGA
jgi:lipoate synthase